jgi:Leucine-rich repeat (LRR) protein
MSIFRPSRRWLRFSLRTFFVFVTLVCIWSAWYVSRARRQKEAAEAVRNYGGWVYYDFQFNDDPQRPERVANESPWPSWLIDTFGVDMFHNVVEVNLVYNNDSGNREVTRNYSDEIIPILESFPSLRRLYLQSTQVTDGTMSHVSRLRKLDTFFVWDVEKLSDKGVGHLALLDRLSSIHISNSRIGDESLRIFSKLPRIERLSLQKNHFTDKGLRYLRDMKQLKYLWIGLGRGDITDKGTEYLLDLENLEEIDLQHYSISSGMQERLKKLPKLKQLVR